MDLLYMKIQNRGFNQLYINNGILKKIFQVMWLLDFKGHFKYEYLNRNNITRLIDLNYNSQIVVLCFFPPTTCFWTSHNSKQISCLVIATRGSTWNRNYWGVNDYANSPCIQCIRNPLRMEFRSCPCLMFYILRWCDRCGATTRLA